MPLRRLRWGVSLPGRTAPMLSPQQQKSVVRVMENEEEDCVCRFCWQAQDAERGGELLAPCRCAGSIRYIHRRCLGAWQRTQRSQGALRKSYKCDICKERYRVRRAPFSGVKILEVQFPTMEEAREFLYSILGSPVWQVVMDVWKILVLANGFYKGILRGVQGFETGARFGLEKFKWYVSSVGACYPMLLLFGWLCTSLQLPALMLTVVSTSAISAQMLISAIVGFYGGALIGFAHGSFQICKGTWCLTRTLVASGTGVLFLAAGGTFKQSFSFLRGIVPFIQQLCSNTLQSQTATAGAV